MMNARLISLVAVIVVAVALASQHGEAHKAITSKYTFNDDVFPIFNERCARCHVERGVAPMSLMTFKDAFPWAESIRAELIAGHMPPWNAEEGFGDLKHARTLTAKELDVVLTWATGGNPQGNLDQTLPAVTLKNDWIMGAPDLALTLPSEFTVPADRMDVTEEFTLPSGTKEAQWVRAVDLLPGTPSVVRSAVIYLKSPSMPGPKGSGLQPTADRVLALWLPGHDPEPLDGRVAFKLPAGAELVVRIHYKKTWQFEGQPIADRSTVGVYFAPDKEAQELLAVPIVSPPPTTARDQILTFTRTIDEDVQALAMRPEDVPPNITLQMTAVLPDGSHAPMIKLNTRPDWARRYWFEKPIALPRGSRIELDRINHEATGHDAAEARHQRHSGKTQTHRTVGQDDQPSYGVSGFSRTEGNQPDQPDAINFRNNTAAGEASTLPWSPSRRRRLSPSELASATKVTRSRGILRTSDELSNV
ncbi:MAG: hypothetical protein AUJ01_07710 [Acidobacteria bacterium 13_1_40CM_3_65_5]|nr:MAG: hypothetical protein AUJ01_07710 [Acidobacteria bacterium 13_1_40CM_3_65_5]